MEGDHLKDRDIDGKIVLTWILQKWNWGGEEGGGMNWLDLA
jgi:hypothetical protein